MSITTTWTCDYCGEEIKNGWARLCVDGWGINRDTGASRKLKDEHHFHAGTADSCYRKVIEALWFSEDFGATVDRLEAIPVASHQAITARRRKHRRDVGDRGGS